MILMPVTTEPCIQLLSAFTQLIHTTIPGLARMPMIKEAMKKYTSGYLTDKRLSEAMRPGTLPLVILTDPTPPHPNDPPEKRYENVSSGHYVPGTDTIAIDGKRFTSYKEGNLEFLISVPTTVFHELAHWGYDIGQRKGHLSDKFGRDHQNHNDFRSPLNDEVERAIRASALLTRPLVRLL